MAQETELQYFRKMNNPALLSEQLCALLIINKGSISSNNSVNSYELIRALSRLFGIIDYKTTVSNLTKNCYVNIESDGSFQHYYLTESGRSLLINQKGHLIKTLKDGGFIGNAHSQEMAEYFVSKI